MNTAWASIVVALISGPIMWVLYRFDKRNTKQHGQAVDLIKSVKDDLRSIKKMQVLTNIKLERHLTEDHNGDNSRLPSNS